MISGLTLVQDWLDEAQQAEVVQAIEAREWQASGGLRRLVQQFGYAYNHGAQQRRPEMVERLPEWLSQLAIRLMREGHFARRPNQVIINRYLPGEGIGGHVDSTAHFGPTVASVSLLSDIVMDFSKVGSSAPATPRLLQRGSLVVLSDTARFDWKHGIACRPTDQWQGTSFERKIRYSITFRTML